MYYIPTTVSLFPQFYGLKTIKTLKRKTRGKGWEKPTLPEWMQYKTEVRKAADEISESLRTSNENVEFLKILLLTPGGTKQVLKLSKKNVKKRQG